MRNEVTRTLMLIFAGIFSAVPACKTPQTSSVPSSTPSDNLRAALRVLVPEQEMAALEKPESFSLRNNVAVCKKNRVAITLGFPTDVNDLSLGVLSMAINAGTPDAPLARLDANGMCYFLAELQKRMNRAAEGRVPYVIIREDVFQFRVIEGFPSEQMVFGPIDATKQILKNTSIQSVIASCHN